MTLPLGKLPPDVLANLLGQIPSSPRVVVGPRVGEDAAVIDMGDRYLVAKADPITFATDEIGWYAVQVNANDLVTTGATPRWFMATILLPGGSATAAMAEDIFHQVLEACAKIDVTLIGGHTEITYGIDRPLVMGTMLGEVEKDKLISTGGAQPGDVVMLTKGFPIEATAIIAREKHDTLAGKVDAATLKRAANMLYEPGISVLRDAQIAVSTGQVTSMHDPTEGGVATALWELAEASENTIEVTVDEWPILPEAKLLCDTFNLDPLGAIASGSLLLTAHPDSVDAINTSFQQADIAIYTLGIVRAGAVNVTQNGKPLTRPDRDEIARLFEG